MSPTPLVGVIAREFADRRDNRRFPFRQEARYRVVPVGPSSTAGCGRTVDMSSRGVLFTTESKLPLGRLIELSVSWPVKLEGTCPLNLVVSGRIVRAESKRAAVAIERYDFRTRRTPR